MKETTMPMTSKDRDTASAIRQGASESLARIRNDKNLSDVGKREAMFLVHKRANHSLKVERARIEERDTKTKANLERRLFGLPPNALGADVISYRDAVDRASRLENADQANTLISRARATGDKSLERAVFAHAYEMAGPGPIARPWTQLVEAYLQARPDLVDDVNELVTCSSPDSAIDLQMQLSLQMPPELVGHIDNSGQLKAPVEVA